MEWKEDALKASILGVGGLIGHWFLKSFKKGIASVKKRITDTEKIDSLEKRIHEFRQYQLAAIHINRNPVYIMEVATGNLIYVNPAWCELLGFYDPEDAYGMGFMRVIPDKDADRVMEDNDRFTKHPSNFSGVITYQHKITKAEIICKCRQELMDGLDGKPERAMGILEVISP